MIRAIPTTIVTCLVCLIPLLVGMAHGGHQDIGDAPRQETSSFMEAPVQFFQTFLSGADGHRCPMQPSCSAYARQAMRRHGSIMGWIMACDRLMRCGRDELKHSPSVNTPHGRRCQDPLDNNDFWLR